MSKLPWVYPYEEDGPRLDTVVLRPIVPISFVGTEASTPAYALVDSGCEHVLAAPWMATAAGVDPRDLHAEITLGLGGESVSVRFLDLTVRLHAPGGDDDDFVEWQDQVGFLGHWRPTWPVLVGQTAFMKQFTVTMSRHSQRIAVEDVEAFDRRFGAS